MANEQVVHLYQKREHIFVRSVEGKFRNFKSAILAVAYTVFFALPWVQWNRARSGPRSPSG